VTTAAAKTRIETRLRASFGLRSLPFTKDLEAEDVFPTESQSRGLDQLLYLVDRKGIGAVFGTPGCGKSTLLRQLSASLSRTSHAVCYLHQTTCAIVDLYREIARGFGLEPRYRKADVMRQLGERLLAISRTKKVRPVLIIDEAHMLHAAFLDELRLLSSFDADGKDELALILAGHPQLEANLRLGVNEALAQRIVIKVRLRSFTGEEVERYLEFRLEKAGRTGKLFLPEAVEAIGKGSRGIPRLVDRIAEHSLLLAMEARRKDIDLETVMQAIDEVAP
jgi:general secretion pathway protein A